MASVIREGGKDPIRIRGWQDCLKSHLIDRMYDTGGVHRGDLVSYVKSGLDHDFITKEWRHRIVGEDIDQVLREMLFDGWIKVSRWVCECCAHRDHKPEEILKHAEAFSLTEKGYDKIIEHIFP